MALRREVHKAIQAVTADIDQFRFNRAVARIYELTNYISGLDQATWDGKEWTLREAIEALITLVQPMMPHLAEEMWHHIGHETLLADQPWPQAEAGLVVEDQVTIVAQVNGKLRAKLAVARDMAEQNLIDLALAEPLPIVPADPAGPGSRPGNRD